jgi:hypothetical protein
MRARRVDILNSPTGFIDKRTGLSFEDLPESDRESISGVQLHDDAG